MQIDTLSPHFQVTQALNGHIRTCFEKLVRHYQDRIRIIKVRLTDVNGPKGGDDKVCRLQVDVEHHPSFNTEGRHTDLYSAITLATLRMERSLSPVLDTTRTRNPNSRHAPGIPEDPMQSEGSLQKLETENEQPLILPKYPRPLRRR
jgi:putative sigma-54 modulation protein